jgi:TRAP-type C4-dicarboxylate transport system permease small subunit
MHTLEQAEEPILSAVAHEAAGPAIVHDETSSPALAFADRLIGTVVEACAAILVAAEIVVLFAGVVSRYVFHRPIVWSDELASFLFLWLAMLGSVVAFRKAEHMRMTALVSKSSVRTQSFFDLFAGVASIAFLLLTIYPALDFALEEQMITTPALEISGAWRASALPVGIGLMLVTGIISLLRTAHRYTALAAIASVAIIFLVLYATGGYFPKFGNYNLLIFFVGIVGALVFAGVPIAFAFGLATMGYILIATKVPTLVMIGRMDEGMSYLILLAVPLFVFLGLLIEMTGMARAMVGFLANLLGHVRGGLSYVLVGAMYLVSGISGSKAADMAAVAPVLFPEMRLRGAKDGDLVALLSATGAQTETIPPSIVLITIGSVTGVSISALFTGGMLPGLVLGVTLCFLVWWRYRSED